MAFGTAAVTADAAPYPVLRQAESSRIRSADLSLSLHCDLAAVEDRWRRFERVADCTAFQSFDWLSAWQRHIGRRAGTVPVIAVGAFADGETAFILPLAVETRLAARRLCWLGQDLCDYTAPLLAPDFARRVGPDRFRAAWRELRRRMQRDPRMRHDWIALEKMPDNVGAQINPFTYLGASANASGAHFTKLGGDWEKFYFEKRSSATRRHDRAKRRHLSEYGEICFINSAGADDAHRMVETLMVQKSRSFARKGIADVFARPGCKEFLLDLASNAQSGDFIHISRVEIGPIWAAVNFGIVFGDTYYHFAASYDDSDLAHYGPGALHLRELMAYAIGLGLQRFDFTIGDEPYKLEWADSHVKLWNFNAAVTWRGWLPSLWLKAQCRLKRLIKQSPWAWQLVCRVRSTIGSWWTPPQ